MAFAFVATEPVMYYLIKTGEINTSLDLATFMGVLLFASIFPDIDEPQSKVSRIFPFNILSYILSIFVKHRGLTHNFCGITLFAILPFIISFFVLPFHLLMIYSLPWMLGYIFHIFGDAMTLSGITNFFCGKWFGMKKQFTFRLLPKLLRFRTFSFKETIYYVFFMIIIFSSTFLSFKSGFLEPLINHLV